MKTSSSKTKRRLIVAGLCLAVAILCFLPFRQLPIFPWNSRGPFTREQSAWFVQETGQMTAQESLRSDDIELSITRTGRVSDADLDFLLHLARTPGTGSLTYTQLRHSDALIALKHLRSFTPGQKEKIYSVASPYLSSADMNEKSGAMAAIRAIKDKRAVPAVTALLNDPDSIIRQQAQKTLTVITS